MASKIRKCSGRPASLTRSRVDVSARSSQNPPSCSGATTNMLYGVHITGDRELCSHCIYYCTLPDVFREDVLVMTSEEALVYLIPCLRGCNLRWNTVYVHACMYLRHTTRQPTRPTTRQGTRRSWIGFASQVISSRHPTIQRPCNFVAVKFFSFLK